MKHYLKLLPLIVLPACVPAQSTVSDYNGDSVKIQTQALASQEEQRAEATAEAERICAKGTKKRAEYASTRQLPNYIAEHLFLCL